MICGEHVAWQHHLVGGPACSILQANATLRFMRRFFAELKCHQWGGQFTLVGGMRRVPEPGSSAALPSSFPLTSARHGLGCRYMQLHSQGVSSTSGRPCAPCMHHLPCCSDRPIGEELRGASRGMQAEITLLPAGEVEEFVEKPSGNALERMANCSRNSTEACPFEASHGSLCLQQAGPGELPWAASCPHLHMS